MKKKGEHKQKLLPQYKKTPKLFRLKVAALVVVILIAVVGIVDVIFLLYIKSHPEPTANLSFVNNIITNTTMIKKTKTIQNLIGTMFKTNPSLYFQQSEFLVRGNGDNFTETVLKDHVFRKRSRNLLYIFDLQNGEAQKLFAIYAASSFPIPSEEDYNKSIDYYTFEQTDERYSMIFSLEDENFLIMNSTSDQIGYLQCKTYVLSEKNSIMNFLSIINKKIDSSPGITLAQIGNQYKCFHGINSRQELVNKINDVIGVPDIEKGDAQIDQYEVYYLAEQ